MLLPDVNVLLGAFSIADPMHDRLRAWLFTKLDAVEPIGLSDVVLSGVIRISTNRRIYPNAATSDEAVSFCDTLRGATLSESIAPGRRHWEIFIGLIRTQHLRANDITDAYLAALALENGASFVTRDRGFARFPGLRVLDPLAA